jgi:hypothetical protein
MGRDHLGEDPVVLGHHLGPQRRVLSKPRCRANHVGEQDGDVSGGQHLIHAQGTARGAALHAGGPWTMPVYYHSSVPLFSAKKRLSATHDRLVRARQDLVVLDEQLGALVVDEESDGHERHIERLRAERVRVTGQIAELEKAQDALLDRL